MTITSIDNCLNVGYFIKIYNHVDGYVCGQEGAQHPPTPTHTYK